MQNENYYFFEKKNKDEKTLLRTDDSRLLIVRIKYVKRKKLERRPRRERRRDDGSDDSGRSRYEVGVGDANDAGAEIRVRRLAFFVFVQASWWRIFRCLSMRCSSLCLCFFFARARKKCA